MAATHRVSRVAFTIVTVCAPAACAGTLLFTGALDVFAGDGFAAAALCPAAGDGSIDT
ncbi:hypothetical protein L3i22_103450 [Actinoplanes sp. L3-i22]|nr:hypothetical protein L3i22_103450 [Actinoplanes sp. L3-i22]